MDFSTIWPHVLHFLETAWIPIFEAGGGMLLGPWVKRIIGRIAKRSNDKGILTFLGSAANLLIIAAGFILAAEALGVKMNSVIALISALSLGISLALKGNMANVAGGLQILMTKPFKVGDYIRVQEHKGWVESVELMFTTIRSDNDKEIVIPNSNIIENTVVNFSHTPQLRIRTQFQIAVGNDFETIEKDVYQMLDDNPYLIKDCHKEVLYNKIASGYVTMEASGYVLVPDYEKCKHRILRDLVLKMPLYHSSSTTTENIRILSEPGSEEISASTTTEKVEKPDNTGTSASQADTSSQTADAKPQESVQDEFLPAIISDDTLTAKSSPSDTTANKS